jgi:hypothetical protein
MQSREKKLRSESNEDPFLMRKLRAAMAYANNTCLFASNKFEDMVRTGGWSLAYHSRFFYQSSYKRLTAKTPFNHDADGIFNCVYSSETNQLIANVQDWYVHVDNPQSKSIYTNAIIRSKLQNNLPLNEPLFRRKPELIDVIIQTLVCQKTRSGNCGERQRLAGKYLWENCQGISSIEGIYMKTFDHGFLIVNRSGDINAPETWGDAWIIDPWTQDGLIFHAQEFRQKIKIIRAYIEKQRDSFATLGLQTSLIMNTQNEEWKCRWQINPTTDPYPTYLSHLKIEDYYQFDDRRFDNLPCTESEARAEHQQLFSDCLDEIKTLGMK